MLFQWGGVGDKDVRSTLRKRKRKAKIKERNPSSNPLAPGHNSQRSQKSKDVIGSGDTIEGF